MKKLILKCFSLLFSRTRLTAAIVAGMLVLATIAAASIVNLPITLTNVDNFPMQLPSKVIIPQGKNSANFQVIAKSTGCVRIKATDILTGVSVTNAFKVVR